MTSKAAPANKYPTQQFKDLLSVFVGAVVADCLHDESDHGWNAKKKAVLEYVGELERKCRV